MNNQTKPEAANRRTNLGIMVLLSAMTLFGILVTITNAGPIRFGIGIGLTIASSLALATFSILVINKKRRLEAQEATA